MIVILKILLGLSLCVFGLYYFYNEYKKDSFKINTWVAGRGQSYFGVVTLIIIGIFLVLKQLLNLL